MANPLDQLMKELNTKYGAETVCVGMKEYVKEKIPFTSPRLNYCLYGGLPTSGAVEFFGPEGSGKTTTALDIVANTQVKEFESWNNKKAAIADRISKLGDAKSYKKEVDKLTTELEQLEDYGPRKCVYIDHENTLDSEWAEKLGVDIGSLILIQPQEQTAEQVLQMVLDIVSSGQVALVVLDSIPMLVPQNIYDENMEKKSYCGVAGPLTTFCSKVSSKLYRHNTLFIGVNQIREDINNPYNQFNTPGGRAWKHLCIVRISFRKGSYINEDNVELTNKEAGFPAGNQVDISLIKSKCCKNDRRVGFYTLKYADGIDSLSDLTDLALKYDLVTKSGSWYNVGTEFKCQGKKDLLLEMRNDPPWLENVVKKLNEIISGT